jgi:hypothetical protein
VVKLLFLCRRRPGLTRQEYARRVLEGHVPLALRHHPTLRRYAVNIAEEAPAPVPPIDGIAALWFDSLADYTERLYDSPEGEEIVRRDVEGFLGGADASATTEIVHRDELGATPPGSRTPGVKWICPLQRRLGMPVDEFVDYWQREHVPRVLEERPGAVKYVTSVVNARLSESGDDWDGFTEVWFAHRDDARAGLRDADEVMRKLGPSRERFIGRGLLYVVSEYVAK